VIVKSVPTGTPAPASSTLLNKPKRKIPHIVLVILCSVFKHVHHQRRFQ
jgi:hypothetical protein